MLSTTNRTYPLSAAGRITLAGETDTEGEGASESCSKIHEGASATSHLHSHSHYKTSIKARVSSRGSANSDSDDDLLASVGSRIFVQRHVDQVSIAMTAMEQKQSPAAYA